MNRPPPPRKRVRVHDGLVGRRALVGTDYLADGKLRAQYESEIAPRTEAQLARVLVRAFPDRKGVARALDLGAGTGAAGRALRDHFGAGLDLVAVDRVAGNGVVVADVSEQTRPAGVHGRFNLIVSAHMLGELTELDLAARADLVLRWWRELLSPGGCVILIEPALRTTSRALLTVRDALVRAGLFIEAPCLWQGPCPALARERDFCHDAAPWVAPAARGRTVATRADFSYLVVRASRPASAENHEEADFRIVSDLLKEKGRLRIWGCGPAGRHALVLQKRDRSEATRPFEDLTRGDLVKISGLREMGDGLRLDPESQVRIR